MHLGINTLFHVPGDVGGTETYLREMMKSLCAELSHGRMTVFTHYDNDHVVKDWLGVRPGITYCRLPVWARLRTLRIVVEQVLLPAYVLSAGVDLLWSPGYTAPYFCSCPQVTTIHDLQYKKYPQDMGSLERVVFDCLVRIACRRSFAIITVSEFSRQEIVRHRFAPEKKIHVVLEGVSRLFGERVEADGLPLEISDLVRRNEPYILCVAHTYPHKNVDLLVRAFGRIRGLIPHNLVVVGKPRRGEEALQQAIRDVSPGNRLTRIVDGASFDVLRLLYQKADVFVLPSVYEGFGLPVVEAMMAETPVVCAREASIPEVGGQHAYYVESLSESALADRIVEVLSLSGEEKDERGARGREWAERFSWQSAAKQTMAAMHACLSCSAGQQGGFP